MLKQKLIEELNVFLDLHLNQKEMLILNDMLNIPFDKRISEDLSGDEMVNFINHHRKPSWKELLFQQIDQHGATDAEIYKRAGIDRRHFSKIRSNPNYHPGKNTVIALAFALQLDIEHTDELLSAAGYSLSDSDTFDLIIQFCLDKGIYDLTVVNEALDHFGEKVLSNL